VMELIDETQARRCGCGSSRPRSPGRCRALESALPPRSARPARRADATACSCQSPTRRRSRRFRLFTSRSTPSSTGTSCGPCDEDLAQAARAE
jgi:hypothetical protein